MNDMSGPLPAAVPSLAMHREPFSFTGTPREYFGIWIVNVLLTILTLGIYSAWAKVRRQRYFYGNTHLAGATFDYHALPWRILVGRIIVVAMLVSYNVVVNFFPVFGLLVFAIFLFAIPWFIMRGLRFNARVTSYRNVRFDFTGGYWGAFMAYIVGGLLIYLSAGLLTPISSRWMWHYMLGNLRYGGRPIECDPRLNKLYGQMWLPAFILIGGGIIGFGIVMAILMSGRLPEIDSANPSGWSIGMMVVTLYVAMIPLFLVVMLAGLIYRAGVRNVVFNETVIDGRHMLASSIGRGRFAWISISNLFATLFTLGLARPWAAIRMASYMATVTALDTTGSLDAYASDLQNAGTATGSEFLDVEGFDLGF
ncbi:YjgN family protein [Aminobacter sp. MET-1]|uniref:YjgN family protein n=1 Tax=Aminobacter sp. MET-1 TaxID=2951085 RepID=UPI002269EF37|nr:YjgN family protein [Aminobacter sp. MET-1]MCX8567878.1 YjgN family protein [Aminobacter sp. MET-1]